MDLDKILQGKSEDQPFLILLPFDSNNKIPTPL